MFFKRRSSKGPLLKKFILFVLVAVFFISLYMTANSSLFRVSNIDIEKHEINCAQDSEIRQASLILGQNFLFLNTKKLMENLKNRFICIKKVVVEKEFPNKIRLNISGREAKLILIPLSNKEASPSSSLENIATPSAQDYSDVFFADDEGVVFSKGNTNLNLPKIFLYEGVVNLGKDSLKKISDIVKILDKVKIFEIDIRSAKIIDREILITDTRPMIIFKLNKDTPLQLASLQLILQQAKIDSNTLELIDLRFDKPIVRFAPKKK